MSTEDLIPADNETSEQREARESLLLKKTGKSIFNANKVTLLLKDNLCSYYRKLTARHMHSPEYIKELIGHLREAGYDEKADELLETYNTAAESAQTEKIETQ
jgi:hypothetical protein